MIFLRGKVGSSQGASGSGTITVTIPDYIQAGDYCVLWIVTSTDTATTTQPAWLTFISSGSSGSTNEMKQYVGFYDGSSRSFTVTMSDTTKAWAFSASFWGGVDTTTPYIYAQFDVDGSANASFSTTTTSEVGRDALNTASVANAAPLNGEVAAVGGTWATSGATTDFAGSSDTTYYPATAIKRATTSDASPRIALLSGTSSVGACSVEVGVNQILAMNSGTGVIRSGCVARYVDANNHIYAYSQISNWSYTSAIPHHIQSQLLQCVVEVTIAGVTNTYTYTPDVTKYGLPYDWPYEIINLNKTHTLRISASGVIDFSVGRYAIPSIDTVALGLTLPSTGKIGIYDKSTDTVTRARYYHDFKGSGSPTYPVVMVAAGMIPNGDTFYMSSTPNNPIAIDEQVVEPASISGRAIGQRYLFMESLSDVALTVTSNLESQSADQIVIGSIVLLPANKDTYHTTSLTPSTRSTESVSTGWKFYLADSSTYEHICLLDARDRNVLWTLNRPGAANCKIRLDSTQAASVEIASTCIIAYRDGSPKWSGPVWTIGEDTENGDMTIGAVGWLQLLIKRLLHPADERYAQFASIDAGMMVAHLLSLTNATDQLPFIISMIVGTQTRQRVFERYQSIGNEVQALSDIESGFDLWFDPATRDLQIWDRLQENLTSSVAFGYNAGALHNLQGVSRQRSAERLVNGIFPTSSKLGSSITEQIDQTSVDTYGLFEEETGLGEISDSNVAIAYAAGELVYRARPLQIFSLKPKQWVSGGNVPRPLEDYHIGSIVKFSAKHGSIDVEDQYARIFSLGLDIDDNDNEKVSTFSTTVEG